MALYALGAPVSIDWGPTYYPHVAGAFCHSVALPESALAHFWERDGPPLDAAD